MRRSLHPKRLSHTKARRPTSVTNALGGSLIAAGLIVLGALKQWIIVSIHIGIRHKISLKLDV